MSDSQSRPLSEDDLSHRLLELCVCEGRFPPCIYCEARDRIDVQDRCLRLSHMLDNAIKRASENGSQAQDIDAMEALEEAERKEVEAP